MNFSEITSVNNEIVKNTAKLQIKKYRKEAKLVVLEGEKSVFGAFEDGLKFDSVFVIDKEKYNDFINKTNAKIYYVNEKVMTKICSTSSIPTILALLSIH